MITRGQALMIIGARERLIELGWNPLQPRWPKGSGKKSGQWIDDGVPSFRAEADLNPEGKKLSIKQKFQLSVARNTAYGDTKGKDPTDAQVRKHLPADHPLKKTARAAPKLKPQPKAPEPPVVVKPTARNKPQPIKPLDPLDDDLNAGTTKPKYTARNKPQPLAKPKAGESKLDKLMKLEGKDFNDELAKIKQELEDARPDEEKRRIASEKVSDKFKPSNLTELHEAIRVRALAAIDKVHKDGTLVPIRLTSDDMGPNGEYRHTTPDPKYTRFGDNNSTYQAADEVAINPAAFNPGLTMIHEIGHFLDNRLLTNSPYSFGSAYENSPAWAEYQTAIHNSEAAITNRNILRYDREGQRYGEYLMSDHELFARAYSQWIITKSDDAVLKKHLSRALQAQRLDPGSYRPQWEPVDFEPISRALDGLFREKGLLHE